MKSAQLVSTVTPDLLITTFPRESSLSPFSIALEFMDTLPLDPNGSPETMDPSIKLERFNGFMRTLPPLEGTRIKLLLGDLALEDALLLSLFSIERLTVCFFMHNS